MIPTILLKPPNPFGTHRLPLNRHIGNTVKVFMVITLVIIIKTFVFGAGYVSSESMQPSIARNSLILIDHLKLGGMHQGDVVTASIPGNGSSIVKRIVALENQTVEVYDGKLRINGLFMDEEYTLKPLQSGMFFGPVTVPEGKVFLMGDNRMESVDSRNFGSVDIEDITGKVSAVLPVVLNNNED